MRWLSGMALWAAVAGLASASPFGELGGAHRQRVAQPAAAAVATLALAPDEARRRLDAYLAAQGFSPSDPARATSALSYVKLTDLGDFSTVADCQGATIGTPKLWIETLSVDLAPAGGGVRVAAVGQFQVLLVGLVSGRPYKITCKSRGVLEGRVPEALAKG